MQRSNLPMKGKINTVCKCVSSGSGGCDQKYATTGRDWKSYPNQPTARVCEQVEPSSGRVPRHFHYYTCPGLNIPSQGVPLLLQGPGHRGRPTSESAAPNILQRPKRRTKWGSPLLDMRGTCLSILSTDGFGGCLAKLDRAEQQYFAYLVTRS
jgi:hypothetical protein